MIRRKHIARLVSLWLALALVLAPVLPALASIDNAGEAHAAHDGDHRAHASAQADHGSKTCTQYDSCAGQCCACCAHCFNAVFAVQPEHARARPVQTPVSSQLHPFFLIASPDRPPRLFFL